MRIPSLLLVLFVLLAPGFAAAQSPYTLFESIPSRPLALSSDGSRLYVVNTPDARLEVYDVSGASPVRAGSVPVGLDPVAVALRTDGEAWVVNHLSDSVSLVDVAANPPHVVKTLLVGDEPEDVIFAGTGKGRAFVTTAHRGQNTVDPRGAYATPGIGRADVWVFDAANPGDDLLATPITIVSLFADRPRALVATPDGSTVYAAAFLSGNRTTTIHEGLVCDGPTATPCTTPSGPSLGGLPAPLANADGIAGPPVGLIVQFDAVSGQWRDELARDWSPLVRFSLPDYDVFAIDANAATPTVSREVAGVGTVLFGMAVHPTSGKLFVANTEARNRVRFEGPGTFVRAGSWKPAGEPASVRGHLHEARITIVDGTTVTPRHLNPHLAYDATPQPASARGLTTAQPVGVAISADGSKLYVAAFGSSVLSVVSTSALEAGSYVPAASDLVSLTGGGPTGVVLDEAHDRAFVATRFDDGLSVVSLSGQTESVHVVMHTPEPAEVVWGRPFLYDARLSSSTGEAACGSCHVFGDFDGLAWDLGNPDGQVAANTNPYGPIGNHQSFHPLKGPMTTQTLRGISTHGPMHWRGDRTGGGAQAADELLAFEAFNVAFGGLLGRDEGAIADADMELFARFALAIRMPPNPIRSLGNTLRADEQAGRDFYFGPKVDTVANCDGCHTLDPSKGFFGTGGLMTFENLPQEFKVTQLRNLYAKVGMFGMAQVAFLNAGNNGDLGPQVRGFGFLHDGSTDTAFRFLHATVFTGITSDTTRSNLEAFLMAFESDLAPIVGQQVTIDASSTATEDARLDLLDARAATAFTLFGATNVRECDLVAHGVVAGEARGYLRSSDATFASDRAAEPPRTKSDLVALAKAAGNTLTFSCVPPGSGVRMALDRDEDGMRDRDELDVGRDPADRPLTTKPGPLPTDGGVPDASVEDASVAMDGGTRVPVDTCGCRVAGARGEPTAPTSVLFTALVLATLVRARSRARRRGRES